MQSIIACDAKIYVQHEYLTFRRIGAKFGVDDGIHLEWVQKEAQSLAFKITKMAAAV